MADPTPQEKTYQRGWQNQQALNVNSSLPAAQEEQTEEENEDEESTGEEGGEEQPTVQDEDQMQQQLYRQRLASQKQQAVEQGAQAEQAGEEGGEVTGEAAAEGEESISDKVAQVGSARILQLAWEFLIPSFGLTILYINLHAFCRYLLSIKKFCKFGSEWMIKKNPAGENSLISGAGEIGEIGVMLIIDFAIIVVILLIIAVLDTIITWPYKVFNALFGWL